MNLPLLKPVPTDDGVWVQFDVGEEPVLVRDHHWVGFDFDGVLSRRLPNSKLEDLGVPVPEMVDWARLLLYAGVHIKVFTARASDPKNIARIQEWTDRNNLWRLEVTNVKDYDLIRFYDDRAVRVMRQTCAN